MKRIISLVMVCVLLIGCIFSLASCSQLLMGTYENETLGTKIEFKLDGTMIYTVSNTSFNGTYEIEKDDDDNLQIEFDFEDEGLLSSIATSLIEGKHSYVKGSENGDSYIKIDGIRYDKVK